MLLHTGKEFKNGGHNHQGILCSDFLLWETAIFPHFYYLLNVDKMKLQMKSLIILHMINSIFAWRRSSKLRVLLEMMTNA